jgi:hypothetical protein
MDRRVIAEVGSKSNFGVKSAVKCLSGAFTWVWKGLKLFAYREMIHQQAIEEMHVVLSQRAQIQELVYVCRLESKLCQAYSLSIMQTLSKTCFQRPTSFLLFFI